jgi:intein/homing endonuclease
MSIITDAPRNIVEAYFGAQAADPDNHFRLAPGFLAKYRGRKPAFGFNGLGEFVFYRTYSRTQEDGSKETFLDTLIRVVEGTYEIQRRHCTRIHVPWDYGKAQASAQEMFELMWAFKFLPPGRGLWTMGTPFMWSRGSAALNNCGFVSTTDIGEDPSEPFTFLMDMSMLGVGVGFDTEGANKLEIHQPGGGIFKHTIADSREGWVDSVRCLIQSYTTHAGQGIPDFDPSEVRKANEPIRGFGGKASGPAILMELLEMLRGLLESRVYKRLSSVDIVDAMNFIGKCVVAGNVRRTAEIVFGDPDDDLYVNMKNPTRTLLPEDLPLWHSVTGRIYSREVAPGANSAEVWRAYPWDFNSTEALQLASSNCAPVQPIPPERLGPAIETFNAINGYRWASNNSIFARVGMNYDRVAASAGVNGEPGMLWLDTVRNYGRMADGRKEGIDRRVAGANPCFSGDMRLLTEHGHRSMREAWVAGGCKEYGKVREYGEIKQLHEVTQASFSETQSSLAVTAAKMLDRTLVHDVYGSQNIVNSNGVVPATQVYRTSLDADLFRVSFSDGSWIDATEQHSFITLRRQKSRVYADRLREERKRLKDLKPGDLVPTSQAEAFGTVHDPEFAEAAGWCIGDGSLSPKADGQVRAQLNCYETDIEHVLPTLQRDLFAVYEKYNTSSHQNPGYVGWDREQEHFEHREQIIGSSVLGRLLKHNGVVPGDKHRVPNTIWESNRQTVAAFLRGLASADGCAQPNESKKSISVRIGQSGGAGKRLLLECRLLLSQFGIASSVHKVKAKTTQLMNDGKGGKKLYPKKQPWTLIISGRKQVLAFLDQVGFIQPWKRQIADLWLANHPGSNNSDTGRYTKVVSVEYLGRGETFCLTEPGDHRVVVEGHEVGQCNEQSLESYELCCLCETFPAHHDSDLEYLRTLKYAYLYAKTVTLLPTHNARTNSVMQRNRRIGLSQSGIVQAFHKFGRRKVIKDFCDTGYEEICHWDEIYSDWLCCTKSIKKTSVKPSGTVSLVVGATPGIHHPEARSYWRRVRVSKASPLVAIYAAAGYHVEPDYKDADRTVIIKFAVADDRVPEQSEITIWEQMANAADYQAHWADNQVSCTVKFKPHERSSIKSVLEVFEERLKGISFLPLEDHNYPQAPYEKCTREEVDAYNAQLQPVDMSLYLYEEATGAKFCDGDTCSMT